MSLLDQLLGLHCPGCDGRLDASTLCTACRAELVPKHLPGFVYLGSYNRFGRLGRAIKYQGRYRLAELLAGELALGLGQVGWKLEKVTAIPTSGLRRVQRGYNQAEILARGIATKLSLPYQETLKRAVFSGSQTQRTLLGRRELSEETFRPLGQVSGIWLLVDDVVTTGTTFARARKALLEAGATKVFGAAIAVRSARNLAEYSL
jgi:predicted amidophosphoribosyltransferase